jgi:tRNA(Ile)-lysidine synthase
VSAVLACVRRTLAAHEMITAGQRVLVAVSGGPDSVGLLGILAHLRGRLRITLVAGHVNHRLRGADSAADEGCAAEAAARVDVPFVRCELRDELAEKGNLEARAREARYLALHRLAAESGCQLVATGHTLDDQAETVLLRLLRGGAPAALAGIRPVRADGVIRPLLNCRRAEIEMVARALGLIYRCDASNSDARFARNRLRHEVFPLLRQLNPKVDENLARVAAFCGAETSVVSAWTEAQLEAVIQEGALDIEALMALPVKLRGHVVRAWLVRAGMPERRLSSRHVISVLSLARGGSASGSVLLSGRQTVRRKYRLLRLGTEKPSLPFSPLAIQPGEPVNLPGGWHIIQSTPGYRGDKAALPTDLWNAMCDADGLEAPLQVRPPRVGERVAPLGLGGTRKLSDVFTDRKVPAAERRTYPVVVCGEAIVWVPGVVRSQVLRVHSTTRRILSLRAWRDPAGG